MRIFDEIDTSYRENTAMDLNGSESPANTPLVEHNEDRVFNTRLRALKQCAVIRMEQGEGIMEIEELRVAIAPTNHNRNH